MGIADDATSGASTDMRAKGCIVPSNGTAVGQGERASVRPSGSAGELEMVL